MTWTAKTAPLVHGAQGAEAFSCSWCCQVSAKCVFHDFSCVVGVGSMSFCMMFLGTYGVLGLGIFEGSSTWKAWKDESGREAKKAVKFTALLDGSGGPSEPFAPGGFTLVLCLKVGPWNSNSFSWNQSNFQDSKWFNMLKFRWVEGPYAQGRTAQYFFSPTSCVFSKWNADYMFSWPFRQQAAASEAIRKMWQQFPCPPKEVQACKFMLNIGHSLCFTQHLIIFNHI